MEIRMHPHQHVEHEKVHSVLPKHFELPDLHFPADTQTYHDVSEEFSVAHGDTELAGKISFQMEDGPRYYGRMSFEMFDPEDPQRRIVNFASTLWKDNGLIMKERYADEQGSSCQVYNRNVEDKGLRRSGLGELSMRAIEEILAELHHKHPEMNIDRIHVFTKLGALANLLNKLGYTPHHSDTQAATDLLSLDTADIRDTDFDKGKEVLYTKKIY